LLHIFRTGDEIPNSLNTYL